jgi:cbb3-type cytochrome oxidase maturation protein
MTNLVVLIPVALFLGGIGLVAFLWALRSGQYEDLDGAAERVLLDEQPVVDHQSGMATQARPD